MTSSITSQFGRKIPRYHISQSNSAQGYQNTHSQALNLQNKHKIQLSVKHALQNAVAMATSNPIT